MKLEYNILIVDDDTDDREILRDAFKVSDEQLNYFFFENGDALVAYLDTIEAVTPSLIVLDLNMPGKDGRETLKDLKNSTRFKHVPIIIFTTSSSQKDKQVAYNLGANCFITKPDTFSKLTELAAAISKLWLQLMGRKK